MFSLIPITIIKDSGDDVFLPFPILLQIEFAPWLINTWTNDFSEASVVCNYIAIEILSMLSSSPAFAS